MHRDVSLVDRLGMSGSLYHIVRYGKFRLLEVLIH
jgi:hypothetical protein